jgi:hypothetical protein
MVSSWVDASQWMNGLGMGMADMCNYMAGFGVLDGTARRKG